METTKHSDILCKSFGARVEKTFLPHNVETTVMDEVTNVSLIYSIKNNTWSQNDSIYLRPSKKKPRDSQFSAHSVFQQPNGSYRNRKIPQTKYITMLRILHNNRKKFIQPEDLLIFFVCVVPHGACHPMVRYRLSAYITIK